MNREVSRKYIHISQEWLGHKVALTSHKRSTQLTIEKRVLNRNETKRYIGICTSEDRNRWGEAQNRRPEEMRAVIIFVHRPL